jgi:hypothetical protein
MAALYVLLVFALALLVYREFQHARRRRHRSPFDPYAHLR